MKVYKYPLPEEKTVLQLPVGSKVLCVKDQLDELVLYATKPEPYSTTTESRTFVSVCTGEETMQNADELEYIDTVMLMSDHFVLHVFELKGKQA